MSGTKTNDILIEIFTIFLVSFMNEYIYIERERGITGSFIHMLQIPHVTQSKMVLNLPSNSIVNYQHLAELVLKHED